MACSRTVEGGSRWTGGRGPDRRQAEPPRNSPMHDVGQLKRVLDVARDRQAAAGPMSSECLCSSSVARMDRAGPVHANALGRRAVARDQDIDAGGSAALKAQELVKAKQVGQRAIPAREDRGEELALARQRGVPERVHAVIAPMQPSGEYPAADRARRQPAGEQVLGLQDTMLAARKGREPRGASGNLR